MLIPFVNDFNGPFPTSAFSMCLGPSMSRGTSSMSGRNRDRFDPGAAEIDADAHEGPIIYP